MAENGGASRGSPGASVAARFAKRGAARPPPSEGSRRTTARGPYPDKFQRVLAAAAPGDRSRILERCKAVTRRIIDERALL